jgi:hypothetical protein
MTYKSICILIRIGQVNNYSLLILRLEKIDDSFDFCLSPIIYLYVAYMYSQPCYVPLILISLLEAT